MRQLALTGLIAAVLLVYGPTAHAEIIAQAELPSVVQETVLQEAGSTALKHIERNIMNGQVVYQIVWQLDNQDIAILVDENGRVLAKDRRPAQY